MGSFSENSEHFLKYILPWIAGVLLVVLLIAIIKHCRKGGECFMGKKSELKEKLTTDDI